MAEARTGSTHTHAVRLADLPAQHDGFIGSHPESLYGSLRLEGVHQARAQCVRETSARLRGLRGPRRFLGGRPR